MEKSSSSEKYYVSFTEDREIVQQWLIDCIPYDRLAPDKKCAFAENNDRVWHIQIWSDKGPRRIMFSRKEDMMMFLLRFGGKIET